MESYSPSSLRIMVRFVGHSNVLWPRPLHVKHWICDTLVFAAFSFSRFFLFLPLVWFSNTSLDLNLSIFLLHAQVPLVPNPCQCHPSNPPHPKPPNNQTI